MALRIAVDACSAAILLREVLSGNTFSTISDLIEICRPQHFWFENSRIIQNHKIGVLNRERYFHAMKTRLGSFMHRIGSRCSIMKMASVACCLTMMGWAGRNELSAQTIRVDATPSHVVNTFSPLYALGTTVDRVPSNSTDVFFAPDQVEQIVSAGWGVVSYRQNTEL